MYIENRAIEVFREGAAHNIKVSEIPVSKQCGQAQKSLAGCLKQNKIHILDGEGIRAKCEVTDHWRSVCHPQNRRQFIEKTFQRQMNENLYNQQELDRYSKLKNNIVVPVLLGREE